MNHGLSFIGMMTTMIGMLLQGPQSISISPANTAQAQAHAQVWIEEARNFPSSARAATTSGRIAGLIDLLDRGSRIIEAALRASNGQTGVGEEFGELYAQLADWLWETGDRNSQQVLDVLVRAGYSADSPFAREIARGYGGRIVPALLEKARSDVPIFRSEALRMLGTVLQNSTLEPTTSSMLHGAITVGAFDPDAGVRLAAVRTLGEIGTAVDLTLLLEIATKDPAFIPGKDGRAARYWVRDAAWQAVSKIQQRSR